MFKQLRDKNGQPIKKLVLNRNRHVYTDEKRRQYIRSKGQYLYIKDITKNKNRSTKIQHGGADDDVMVTIDETLFNKKKETINPNAGTSKYFKYKCIFIKDVIKGCSKIDKNTNKRTSTYGVSDSCYAINEVLASKIYRQVYGLNVLDTIVVNIGNKYYVGSKFNNKIQNFDITKSGELRGKQREEIMKGFFVDCIMANWDLAEPGNIALVENGNYARIDLGGTMKYRAMGGVRTGWEDTTLAVNNPTNEFMTYTGKCKPIYRIFKHLSKNDVNQAEKVILCDAKFDVLDTLKDRFQSKFNQGTEEYILIENLIKVVKDRHKFYTENRIDIINIIRSRINGL
jgi:hypothetical protein